MLHTVQALTRLVQLEGASRAGDWVEALKLASDLFAGMPEGRKLLRTMLCTAQELAR